MRAANPGAESPEQTYSVRLPAEVTCAGEPECSSRSCALSFQVKGLTKKCSVQPSACCTEGDDPNVQRPDEALQHALIKAATCHLFSAADSTSVRCHACVRADNINILPRCFVTPAQPRVLLSFSLQAPVTAALFSSAWRILRGTKRARASPT